jgi:hypothetical protein
MSEVVLDAPGALPDGAEVHVEAAPSQNVGPWLDEKVQTLGENQQTSWMPSIMTTPEFVFEVQLSQRAAWHETCKVNGQQEPQGTRIDNL